MRVKVTLEDGRELVLPILHFGCMGAPSSGKTHLLASMPKPLLVLATDPFDKMAPYYDRGVLDDTERVGQFGQPIRLVTSATSGNAIIQIEGFFDTDPSTPQAMAALLARAEQLRPEVLAGRWASIAIDSWTHVEYIARERRTTGPLTPKGADKDGRRIYGAAKDDVQRFFNSRFVHLPCNVGVALHTTEKRDEDGNVVYRGLKAMGELKTELPGALGERYLAVNVDGTTRRLDTRNVAFNCCTLIDAPNPCANSFQALFTNYIIKRAAQAAPAAAATPAAQTKESKAS